jgi:hypothetical protein
MSEVMEHRQNSFELFGLDFVIDRNLKCWLIEANMSPACAQRQGQDWLDRMADDMSDGMVNILEDKILRSMAASKVQYNGPMQDKIDQMRQNKELPTDLTQWCKLEFEQNQPQSGNCDYQGQYKALQGLNLTKQFHQEQPLVIRGTKANLKFEKWMD